MAPYVTTNADNETRVHLTPRLMSYYEVSILSCPDEHAIANDVRVAQGATDCIAIGIATKNFSLHSRMPGWDAESYAYHGDDGGIFHGNGSMSHHFGPSFGEGDTVGCGIDYVTQGIFFTLNGEILGYGWTGVETSFLKQELYPTVGVDSNLPIECNFGERPFAFDLTSYLSIQMNTVKECWYSSTAKRADPALTK